MIKLSLLHDNDDRIVMMIEIESYDDNNDDEYNYDGCLDYSNINITIIHLI